MRYGVKLGLALLALGASLPAAAATVSAQKPESLVEALQGAGYQATLGTDDLGDPVIDATLGTYKTRVLFLDCDEQAHDKCGSIQFFASFDADDAGMSANDAILFARRFRYASVTVNANGDPTLRWDIETGEGIPRDVFVAATARFLGTVQAMGATLFPAAPAAPAG